eukprot:Seg83.7 transcript_id=Seg83.7/GoldUCD/mRNA.D3Y31 product="hypothetical protein" protein_id=Seg83.7/GoldUCD/D3Y31
MKDHLEIFSNKKVESSKEIVLQSIIQILPAIINDSTPAIIKSAEGIIKTTLNENAQATNLSRPDEQSSAKYLARQLEQSKKTFLNKKLGYRKNIGSTLVLRNLPSSTPNVSRKNQNTFLKSLEKKAPAPFLNNNKPFTTTYPNTN